jgi:hypothetical protein
VGPTIKKIGTRILERAMWEQKKEPTTLFLPVAARRPNLVFPHPHLQFHFSPLELNLPFCSRAAPMAAAAGAHGQIPGRGIAGSLGIHRFNPPIHGGRAQGGDSGVAQSGCRSSRSAMVTLRAWLWAARCAGPRPSDAPALGAPLPCRGKR